MHQLQQRPLTALDTIFIRRSVRGYAPGKIAKPTIRALLDAAVQAPTAMHVEPWAFVIVQDEAMLKRVSEAAKASWTESGAPYRGLADPDFDVFYDAGTLIVICARPESPFVVADCWLAAENLMLAACALGLGTCCIGSAIPALNEPEIKSALAIPDDVQAVAPIVVGVPRGAAREVSRREPLVLSWT